MAVLWREKRGRGSTNSEGGSALPKLEEGGVGLGHSKNGGRKIWKKTKKKGEEVEETGHKVRKMKKATSPSGPGVKAGEETNTLENWVCMGRRKEGKD